MRNILISALLLLLIVCLVSTAAGAAGTVAFALAPPKIEVPPAPDVGEVYFDPQPQELDSPDLPASAARQMDDIQAQVVQIRGLIPQRGVYRDVLTSGELHQRVTDEFFEDFSEQDALEYARVLSVLGLMDADTDVHQLFLDLYSEQVAGYYDPAAESMFVIQGTGFGGTERMTYAHEYTHALQDQTYDLLDGLQLNDEACLEASEYCAAVTALIEGDAVLTETLWFVRYATEEDRQQVQEFAFSFETPVFDALPPFLSEDFLFPYREGHEFVSTLYDQGGFTAVDAAYQNPPQSTEQILHPHKYPADTPLAVELPDIAAILDPGWVELDHSILGEWYTYLVLAYGMQEKGQLPLSEARTAAAGWQGDRYAVYWQDSDNQGVLLLHSLWETPEDAQEFQDAFTRYGKGRWGVLEEHSDARLTWQSTTAETTLFLRQDTQTLWVLAPDIYTAESLAAAAGFPLEE